ncbi:hypothetical protein SAZ11_54030 [Streptomyces sp. FXJ1.4098]|nr:hypothetical protein [Streptomyces sp. FXJ1.4098]
MPEAAAPISAAASLSGLLSGWLYGLRRHRAPAHRQLVVATGYLAGTGLLLPLALAPAAGLVLLVLPVTAREPGLRSRSRRWCG